MSWSASKVKVQQLLPLLRLLLIRTKKKWKSFLKVFLKKELNNTLKTSLWFVFNLWWKQNSKKGNIKKKVPLMLQLWMMILSPKKRQTLSSTSIQMSNSPSIKWTILLFQTLKEPNAGNVLYLWNIPFIGWSGKKAQSLDVENASRLPQPLRDITISIKKIQYCWLANGKSWQKKI